MAKLFSGKTSANNWFIVLQYLRENEKNHFDNHKNKKVNASVK
jgi:hypothetical protein